MSDQEQQIVEHLRTIKREDHLYEILVNLLDRMHLEPILTHGQLENGVDIVCKETNHFGIKEYIGLVVKVGKIRGGASRPNNLETVITQVQEAFRHPYPSPSEKQPLRYSKVLVVTNEEVAEHAREKLLEKLDSLGPLSANIHFFGGRELAPLLAAHWKDFTSERTDLVQDEDNMPEDAGALLYVAAKAYANSRQTRKKPVRAEIKTVELYRRARVSEANGREALRYLIDNRYLQKETAGRISLNRKYTRDRLLTEVSDIELLTALAKQCSVDTHITEGKIYKIAQKPPLSFQKKYVAEAIRTLLIGSYLAVDKSHGRGHYRLNIGMFKEEQAYLACWHPAVSDAVDKINK